MDNNIVIIFTWFCLIGTNEAATGDNCTNKSDCGNGEICASGKCGCNTGGGYENVGGVCKPKIPKITIPQLSYTANIGSSVTIICHVNDTAEITGVVWIHTSTGGTASSVNVTSDKYSGGTTSEPSLTIASLVVGDGGTYYIRVQNSRYTTDGKKVSLTMTSPIRLSVTGPSNSVIYGSNTVLTATITTSVNVTAVTWQKVVSSGNPVNLTIDSSKYTQTGDLGSGTVTLTLTISNLNFNDEASYQVHVTNSLGTTNTSNQVVVDVAGGPPNVSVTGPTQSGTTVTIGCNATITADSPSVSAIRWKKGEADIDISNSNGKYSGGTVSSPALIINNIAISDEGDYRCVTTNPAGSTTSTNKVTLAPPADVKVIGPSAVLHGASVTYSGSYTSVLPTVTVKWQKAMHNNYEDIDLNSTDGKYAGSTNTGSSPKLEINLVKFTDRISYRMVVSNGVGSTSSDPFTFAVTGGELTVTAGPDVSGRFGRSVTVKCNVTGPEVNNIQWKKISGSNSPKDIDINNTNGKYTGGTISSPSLIINSLVINDGGRYRCTASNPKYTRNGEASVTVNYGQFNEDCTEVERCDVSESLTCNNGKCLCNTAHYHKNEVCYPRSRLAPSITSTVSTTLQFTVFWNHTSIDYGLVTSYRVSWRVSDGSSPAQNQSVGRTMTSLTVSSGLMSGQLYTVTVTSVVGLINPVDTINVPSQERTVRLVPLPPGSVLLNESSFAHGNLTLKWTPPANNTIVTKYEVKIDNAIQTTLSSYPSLKFAVKVLTPGSYYVVSIVTISGTSSDEKRSTTHNETIRITPTRPDPPTDVVCPQHPLDTSLEISWTPPSKPNGQILKYQINRTPGNSFYTPNNQTKYNVVGLNPQQTYTFVVRTVNDAEDSLQVSEPSVGVNCQTKAGVPTPLVRLSIKEVQSRGFQISFEKPEILSGQLAAFKILIFDGSACVQQIIIAGNCPRCMNTNGCPAPLNYTVSDVTQPVMYSATALKPYTNYVVKVAAVNGEGEGHFDNTTAKTDEEIPQKPRQITATNIEATTLTLFWKVADPSPGNTTYTVDVYEGTDDTGSNFTLKRRKLDIYGFNKQSVSIGNLEEYWPYKFKVDAATIIGNITSDFSNILRTKQAAPGQVEDFTVGNKDGNYRMAYVYWRIPSLRNRNGVLQSYHFGNNHTGMKKVEEIPVSLSPSSVERNFTVEPEEVYFVEVYVKNNESMQSKTVTRNYTAPAGPPPINSNKELITTRPGEHRPSERTFTIEINIDFFTNDLNGKQVFFGIAVCEKSRCESTRFGTSTEKNAWEGLPNWHEARESGFPLYRVTDVTYMEYIRGGASRWKRSTSSDFTIGIDTTCPSLDSSVYCNGPLNPGQSYKVIIFACTNGGCTQSKAYGPYYTIVVKIDESTHFGVIHVVGSLIGVVVVLVVVVTLLVFLKRRDRKKQNDDHTYADLELNERNNREQVYQKLDRGTRILKEKAVPVHRFVSHVEDMMKDSKLKIYHEFSNLLLSTGKGSSRIGQSKNNMPRNRSNIVPYDFNRVKLLEGRTGSKNDYMNASFILDQHYIMTQYPLPRTFGHFWQMVWEQNASAIVVLSDDSDDDNKEQYFPVTVDAVCTLGGIDVKLLATFNMPERATLRNLRLSKNSFLHGKQFKNVNHFHVHGLKKANLPEELLNCISLIKSNKVEIKETGPLIVHGGGSGTDYSGVFIPIDYLIKVIESGARSVDVYGTASRVMNERMLTINTEEQYSVIYTCLQKFLLTQSNANTSDEKLERIGAVDTYEYLP